MLFRSPFRESGNWSTTLVYGANTHAGEHAASRSVLGESNLELGDGNSVFGRVETVRKSLADLGISSLFPGYTAVPPQPGMQASSSEIAYDVSEITLGYVRELATGSRGSVGIGFTGTLNAVPWTLEPVYGSRTPLGGAIFLRLRPGVMNMNMRHTSKKEMPMHDMNTMGGPAQ